MLARSGPRSNAPRSLTIPGPEPQETPIEVVLGPEHAGERLDKALAVVLPDYSRTALRRWIEAGLVTTNGDRGIANKRVSGGERIVIRVPPPQPTTLLPEPIPISILYEDDAILLIDKPSGLTVHPGAGQRSGTLANALVHHLRNLPKLIGGDRPGIVHRLDKDTSGIMVIARTESAQRKISQAFADRTVQKTYLAAVHGADIDEAGEITHAIARSKFARTKMTIVEEGGRHAETRYEVERRMPGHALVRCYPRTGRTHQLRVHLRAIRHPIVGDPIYGWRTGVGDEEVPRLLLHAWRLAFDHPVTGERVSFEAPIPPDYEQALETLAQLPPPRRPRR